jgi:hypothetical protein
MLAEKIIKVLSMGDFAAYNELCKMGYNIDNKVWKEYTAKYDGKSGVHNKLALIHILCEKDIIDTNRKKSINKGHAKRIKAIEKFLDRNRKEQNTKDRPVFHHFLREENKVIYTNCYMLGVIDSNEVQGINEKYNLNNIEGLFPDYKRVIPDFSDWKTQTVVLKYSDVLAQYKLNKANKAEYNHYIVNTYTAGEDVIGAYNAEYLLHCFEVLGVDEITLTRKDKKNTLADWQIKNGQIEMNLQIVKVTAEGTNSFLVVNPVRITPEQYAAALKNVA